MLANVTIRTRLSLLAVFSVLMVIVVGAIGVGIINSLDDKIHRTRDEAMEPVIQVLQINELMESSFRQLYASTLHDTGLKAAEYHNHPIAMHTDAIRTHLADMDELWAAYRDSHGGLIFAGQANRAQASRDRLVAEGLKAGITLAEAEKYAELGVFMTATILPLFNEAKTNAHDLLGKHKAKAAEIIAAAGTEADAARVIMLVGGGLASVLLVIGAIAVIGSIVKPMGGLSVTVQKLAGNDTSNPVDGSDRRDEIGPLAQALEQWRRGLIATEERCREDLAQAERQAARQRRIEAAMAKFDSRVGGMMVNIGQAVEHLARSADVLTNNAHQTEQQSAVVAAATEQATANVQTVASASTELSASIQEISRQVQQSAEYASAATGDAEQANRKVSALADMAQKIGEIVGLINNIAAQTNLLALNATIESARAGEAGKGFAVVANEVKHLAGQTSRATDDIAAQVATVQAETLEVVKAIEAIAARIKRINEFSTSIAGAVEEQGAATVEIARNVDQASQGTAEVAANIGRVASEAADTGRLARTVLEAADGLRRESDALRGEVESFLGEVRQA